MLTAAAPKTRAPLTEARKHQEEVEKSLTGLLKLLEPWSSTREVKGEAKAILQEQDKLNQDTTKLSKEIPAGENREKARWLEWDSVETELK